MDFAMKVILGIFIILMLMLACLLGAIVIPVVMDCIEEVRDRIEEFKERKQEDGE